MDVKKNAVVETKAKEANRFTIVTRAGETLKLDKETVVKYITNGTQVTDPEFNMFFQLCKTYGVNPFLKEAYLIKYGNTPATIVLDYKVLQQIAEENPHYRGMKHGIVAIDKEGNAVERVGAYLLPNERLVGGWCEVYRDDKEPTKAVAMFEEFKNTKRDGTVNSNWTGKPCFMIDKVAKAQALREAFPTAFGSNVYTPEEASTFDKPEPQPKGKTTIDTTIIPEADEPIEAEVEEAPEDKPEPEADEYGEMPF